MREYGRTPKRAAVWHELVRFPGKKAHGSKEYGGAREEDPAEEEESVRGDVWAKARSEDRTGSRSATF
jgi:hypothetical protein